MSVRRRRRALEALRWASLGVAVVVLVVFLQAQRQSVDVSYGRSPSSSSAGGTTGSAGESSAASVPSVEEMTALVAADPVVRLPGSIARWNEQRVREVIGSTDVRILVAPPGLDEDERKRLRDVENATVLVVGTEVSGGFYRAVADDLPSWRAQFAVGDVTGPLLTLITALQDRPAPPDLDELTTREPTARELAVVAADLRASGLHCAAGATLTDVPAKTAKEAFPDGAWFAAFPAQRDGTPLPRYGPALAKLFPDQPIVVLHGLWIEYHGPGREDFAELVEASFYGQFADLLSRSDYPQRNALGVYLNRVTDVRYAGLFDRPLPYRPADPLRVALPALPWVFAACVAAFLALSVRSLRRAGGGLRGRIAGGPHRGGVPARLAGLTALAVEMSLLTDVRSDPALTRGIVRLQAAREALGEELPDRHVHTLLAKAANELDDAARTLGIPGYRPDIYLQGRLT
ncbi:hypothetical protein [Micromonospora sp. RTGN7]|uniref:hypothetical protein n=1 Tax=Micromonospora sp. RTGN7 TaxID=3016526 RepID=UPI0029FF5672|nr:hypothetical protein [Micromonospora sp. RTGN7]